VTPDKTFVFLITNESFHTVELPIDNAKLQELIAVFSFPDKSDMAAIQIYLEQLYQGLIAPIKDDLHTQVVGVVPHGVLHRLPFNALINEQQEFFGDKYRLFTLPGASVLRFVQEQTQQFAARAGVSQYNYCAAFGYSPDGELHLEGPEQEVERLVELFPTLALKGEEATETALKSSAADADILHISAHGVLNVDLPIFSHVLLAPDGSNDGLLEIHEVYELELSRTELVVMSACKTQRGRQSRGDDIISLNRAFIYAGSPSVIASLWSVDDLTTRDFMDRFYTALAQGRSKAEALQEAREQIRRGKPHPYYWAAFVLTGNPGQLSGSVETAHVSE
jgi:CHAT domain-containing protein